VRDVIASGLHAMQSKFFRLLGPIEVGEEMLNALHQKTPLSIIRLGDGELLTLAQDTVFSVDEVKRSGPFLPYAGVNVPDIKARDRLAHAIRLASIVGIPKLRLPNFQQLLFPVFQAHHISYTDLRLTTSTINYELYTHGYLPKLLTGRRVLLIGNLSPGLANVFYQHGIIVTDAIAPVNGVRDCERIMQQVHKSFKAKKFDLSLVSAGVAAAILVPEIANTFGVVALDFGHLADSLIRGDAPFR
jgi:hypothetical protein